MGINFEKRCIYKSHRGDIIFFYIDFRLG